MFFMRNINVVNSGKFTNQLCEHKVIGGGQVHGFNIISARHSTVPGSFTFFFFGANCWKVLYSGGGGLLVSALR